MPIQGATLTQGAAAERDQRIAALFDRHYVSMCRLAYVILGDAAVAEEVVMDALVKTYSGWGRIRQVEHADAYLKRTVVNMCRSRIRRKVVETRYLKTQQHPEARVQGWDPDRHEIGRVVWDAVLDLPERQRACVVLRYFDDLSESQIADVLDCSIGTVKSQLSKARAKLERSLPAQIQGGV